MRETLDPVEAEGVAVAHETAQQADLVLSVLDCSNYLPSLSPHLPETTSCLQMPFGDHTNAITVFNKVDALSQQQRQQLEEQLQGQLPKQLSEQLQESGQVEASVQTLRGSSRQKTPPPGRQPFQSTPQPPGRQSLDLTALQASAINDVPALEGLQASAASWESLLQNPQLSQAVLCSCKTGWNMDVVVKALERGVRNIMESGQDSQEGLVITRCSVQSQCDPSCIVLSAPCHAWSSCCAMLCCAVPCCVMPGFLMLSHAVPCFCSAVHLCIDT